MKYIILDRDGVINIDSPDFIKSPDEWIPIQSSLIALKLLHEQGYHVLIATNQSGIGRGYYSEAILQAIHDKMMNTIEKAGGKIAHIFFCPHVPEDYCECRKPNIGLWHQIITHYPDITLDNTFSVGDSLRDIEAAISAGSPPVLVKTGNGLKTLEKWEEHPRFYPIPVFEDLLDFTCALLDNSPLLSLDSIT